MRRLTLAQQAAFRLSRLWDSMAGVQLAVWVDNCYRRRYTSHPSREDVSFNCTAVTVLHLPRLHLAPPRSQTCPNGARADELLRN